jgi:amylovoran biosynthesis glycosyltransferase AmsB
MKISVVIPFYENYSTISLAVESTTNQEVPVHEIIIVDDFSSEPERLTKLLVPFQQKAKIILLRNSENKNGAFSRNRGINQAKGQIVAFLDADDTWEPLKTRKIIEAVKEKGEDNIFFSKAKIKRNGIIIDSRPKHFSSQTHISEYLFLEGGFIQTSTIFCSLKIAKSIMFQEQFKRHQDYDFVLRAYSKGISFVFIDQELITYKEDTGPNLGKGEAYDFSLFWLNSMREYFSRGGYLGFKLFNLTARLISEKRFFKAVLNALSAAFGLRPNQIIRAYPKLIRVIKKRKFTKLK